MYAEEDIMSTRPDLLENALAGDIFEMEAAEPRTSAGRESIAWNPVRFGEEQIRSLVRQVFLPGWPKPARQVVFCAVEGGEVDEICLRVGQVLAAQIPGSVALVEAHLQSTEESGGYGDPVSVCRPAGFGPGAIPRGEFPAISAGCRAKCSWVKTRLAFRWNGCPAG